MKSFCLLLLAGILVTGTLTAAERPLTAFETLKLAREQLGDSGASLLSMECDHANLRPRYWWIRFYDEKLFLKLRSVQMIGPDMIRNVEPGNIFDGGDKRYIIEPELLKYDSEKCIAFMEKVAKESGIPLQSLAIKLEKPYIGESNPIWFFEWFDGKGASLGKMSISATTGKVSEIVGLRIKSPRFMGVSKKTVGQEVSDTFTGVGADMEEFFTGKRTVDKDNETSQPAEKKTGKAN